MKNYFIRLLKYNEWANNRILEIMLTDGFNEPSAVKLFSHIVAAQQLWLDRILMKQDKLEVWPDYTVEGCIALSKESTGSWIKFLELMSEEDLDKIISYTTTQGVPYSNSVADILTHLVIHSSYHRAQIAKKYREAGINPPNTDFIQFARTTNHAGIEFKEKS